MTRRADKLKIGDVVRLGVHTAPIVRIIQESPRILLIHVATGKSNGLPFVYRKRANTLIQLIAQGE